MKMRCSFTYRNLNHGVSNGASNAADWYVFILNAVCIIGYGIMCVCVCARRYVCDQKYIIM